jgi:hypothetical protein
MFLVLQSGAADLLISPRWPWQARHSLEIRADGVPRCCSSTPHFMAHLMLDQLLDGSRASDDASRWGNRLMEIVQPKVGGRS